MDLEERKAGFIGYLFAFEQKALTTYLVIFLPFVTKPYFIDMLI